MYSNSRCAGSSRSTYDCGAPSTVSSQARSRSTAALHGACHDGAAAGDGEHVLHRQQEGRVQVPLGHGHIGVHGVEQRLDGRRPPRVALQGLQPRDPYDGHRVAAVAVRAEQFADLQLDEVGEHRVLAVVDGVGLVERDHDVVDAHLPGEQHVFGGLRHDPVQRGDDEDRPVELRGAGDHVLDVVGVAGHVDVRVVPGVGLVLDVRDVDGDAARRLLRGAVDAVEGDVPGGAVGPALGEDLGDGGGQGGLAVVDMAHRADVQMRFGADVRRLGHGATSKPRGGGGDPWGRPTLPLRGPPDDPGRVSFGRRRLRR
ncbi:hypothetical protein SVIOM342S_06151 [Streptomyces violaceorubidus]